MAKISQKNLLIRVKKTLAEERLVGEGDTVIVAVSGGPDSVCLLDIFARLREKLKINLKAAHFNHKLRGAESERDEKFVRKLCLNYGIELTVDEWKNKPKNKGCNTQTRALGIDPLLRTESLTIGSCNKKVSEEDARDARYSFFSEILKREGEEAKVALAHNSDDLAETMLQRIIRGTGLKGLKSIPFQREKFIRPLLKFSRQEIMAYLIANNIKSRTDKSNLKPDFLRNKIRLTILPKLRLLNPRVSEALQVAASSIDDDYDYLSAQAERMLASMIESESGKTIIIDAKGWSNLHPALGRLTLRLAIERLGGGEDLNYFHIENIRSLIYKNEGKKSLPLPHHLQVRLERGKIIVSKE